MFTIGEDLPQPVKKNKSEVKVEMSHGWLMVLVIQIY